jgi:hypothetical protein
VGSTIINSQAVAAREAARGPGGLFGVQQHQPATITLGGPADASGYGTEREELLDYGSYLSDQLPENRHELKMWTAGQEIEDATGVPLWETLAYADGFMKDFDPGTSEHDEFLAAMAVPDEWNVDLDTARTIDSRLREVYEADIDADDVHAHGSALAPRPEFANA